MIEKEYKYELSLKDYQVLEEYMKEKQAKTIINKNYYFESKNDFSCRIRRVNMLNELTFKKRLASKVSTHLEITLNLSDKRVEEIFSKKELILTKEELAKLDNLEVCDNYFKLLGLLETKRMELVTTYFSICLDDSKYFKKEDYELELEQLDSSLDLEDEVKAFLANLNLNLKASKSSKQRRFMEELRKEN